MTDELPQCSTCGREAGQSWSPDNHCGTEKTGPACTPSTLPPPDEKAAGLQTLLLARALPAKALDALETQLKLWQSFAEQEDLKPDETMAGAMKITQKAVMADALDWAYRHLSAQPPGTGMKVKEILYRYQRYRLGLDVTVNADGVVTMGGGA